MSNDVTKPEPNYFELYGEQVTPRNWLGDLMRFNKFGEFVCGSKAEEIPIGTKLLVLMNLLEVGYQHWQDNRPGERRMGFISNGFVPPRRAELGDLDKARWDRFESGEPKDPWVFANLLPMASAEGALLTFTTSSKGGLSAV